MADLSPQHQRAGNSWLDIIVALAAVCISLASLWVALRADRIQERLLTASVWPVLLYESSNYVETDGGNLGRHIVRFTITNAGIGPAQIKWFDMYYGGKPIANVATYMQACCKLNRAQAVNTQITSNYMQNRVLAAHEAVHFVEVPRIGTNATSYRLLDRERQTVYVRACYCSALDDCWIFDSRKRDRAAISECPKPDTPLFRG